MSYISKDPNIICNVFEVQLHQTISFRHADSQFAMMNLFGVLSPAKLPSF